MIAHLFDYDEICHRWHQATVRNDLRTWLAIGYWLSAEAAVANADKRLNISDDMATISAVAMQRAKDLQPQREMEAAA